MKILVTGGAGFIGSNFIRYLLGKYKDYRVVNLDKLTYAGNPDNLRDLENDPRYTFIKGDICDAEAVEKAAAGIDAIINFAAETHVDRSILAADSFIDTDVKGTYTLLEAARKHLCRRFIQISTDEVYGSIEDGSFHEASPLCPNSPYSASKAAGDMIARSYYVTYKVPVIITRSSNNFGPYQYPEKVIPLFVTNALENKPLPLYGDGNNVRDWLFVTDNCKAIDAVLHQGVEGEIYNIGGGNEIANGELTRLILDLLKKPHSLIKNVPDRPGHDRRYSLDCSKVRNTLQCTFSDDFIGNLAQTVNWYKDNEWWWKKLKDGGFDQYYRRQYSSI